MSTGAVGSAPAPGFEPDTSLGPDTRERLVRAATEVFLERGYGGTRVQDIARRAGYTSGALYQHFPSRTALLAEAISVAGRSIMDGLIEVVSAVEPGDGAVANVLAHFTSLPPTPIDRLLLEALALASSDDEARTMLAESIHRLGTMIGEQIDVARNRGILNVDVDSEALRQVFVSWLFGVVVMKAVGVGGVSQERLVTINERLLAGLSAPA